MRLMEQLTLMMCASLMCQIRSLLRGFNLHVKKGQRIAIVGPTGCGKTTVINLLMRFYDVNSGSIDVSGTDIRQMTRKSLKTGFWYGSSGDMA